MLLELRQQTRNGRLVPVQGIPDVPLRDSRKVTVLAIAARALIAQGAPISLQVNGGEKAYPLLG